MDQRVRFHADRQQIRHLDRLLRSQEDQERKSRKNFRKLMHELCSHFKVIALSLREPKNVEDGDTPTRRSGRMRRPTAVPDFSYSARKTLVDKVNVEVELDMDHPALAALSLVRSCDEASEAARLLGAPELFQGALLGLRDQWRAALAHKTPLADISFCTRPTGLGTDAEASAMS